MAMTFVNFAKTLGLTLLIGSLAACRFDNEPALRVGANIWPGYESLHLARRLGRYDEHEVVLVDFASAVDVMRAYRNGVIDVAALTADEALTIAETEPGKHKIVLLADFSNGADCIVSQSAIATFADLKGRRIGVESNAVGAYVLLRALQLHDMNAAMIVPAPLIFERHEQAMRAESVDAVVTFEPRCSRLLAAGGRLLFTSREIPNEVAGVLLTRATLIETRAAKLKQLIDGWFAAADRLRREPSSVAAWIAAHQGIAPEALPKLLDGLRPLDRADNARMLSDNGEFVAILEKLSVAMRAQGLLATPVDARLLIDRRLVASDPL